MLDVYQGGRRMLLHTYFLAETFCVVTFSRTYRQCNSVVYNLAKYTRHGRCLSGWKEDVPSHLLYVTLANFG